MTWEVQWGDPAVDIACVFPVHLMYLLDCVLNCVPSPSFSLIFFSSKWQLLFWEKLLLEIFKNWAKDKSESPLCCIASPCFSITAIKNIFGWTPPVRLAVEGWHVSEGLLRFLCTDPSVCWSCSHMPEAQGGIPLQLFLSRLLSSVNRLLTALVHQLSGHAQTCLHPSRVWKYL